jgi:hypothetical protein
MDAMEMGIMNVGECEDLITQLHQFAVQGLRGEMITYGNDMDHWRLRAIDLSERITKHLSEDVEGSHPSLCIVAIAILLETLLVWVLDNDKFHAGAIQ